MIRKGLIILSLLLVIGVLALREHAKTNDYGWYDGFWINGGAHTLADVFDSFSFWPHQQNIGYMGEEGTEVFLEQDEASGEYYVTQGGFRLRLPIAIDAEKAKISNCLDQIVHIEGVITSGLLSEPKVTRLDTVLMSPFEQPGFNAAVVQTEGLRSTVCYASKFSSFHPNAPLCVGATPYDRGCALMTATSSDIFGYPNESTVCVENIVPWMKSGDCVWMSKEEALAYSEEQRRTYESMLEE